MKEDFSCDYGTDKQQKIIKKDIFLDCATKRVFINFLKSDL